MHSDHHSHSHTHTSGLTTQRRLLLSIGVTVGILLVEIAGGIMANSLALLSDAGHVFTDLAALVFSFVALRLAARPATSRKTYGFHRFEILSALVNGVTLVVISLLIFVEAYRRLRNPEPVHGAEVMVVAILGLIGNGIGVWLLHDAGDNLNVRGAFLHLVGDALSSVGVIISAAIIVVTGWWIIDPLVSIGIGVLIVVGAGRLIGESIDVLLEGTPRHIDPDKVIASITSVPGVCSVHDVHIWCVTPQLCTMSGHVLLQDDPSINRAGILSRITAVLASDHGIDHTTIQIEDEHCGRDDHEWLAVK